MGGILMLCFWLCACSSHHGEADELTPATLSVYVYTPDNPVPTRANTDYVTGEANIYTLQLWVFRHDDGTLVGYFTPASTNELVAAHSAIYQMVVTPQFAQEKPNVDVYVLANVTAETCGCSFNESTTRAQLDEALLQHQDGGNDYFGLTDKVSAVPSTGIPMSGVLKDQPVTGQSPVFRVGESELATVKLVRAVSRLRFVFSQMRNDEGRVLRVTGITLTGDMILPRAEHLFLTGAYETGYEYRIKTEAGYEEGPITMASESDIDEVATCEDPLRYIYNASTMTPQSYENLIASGLASTAGQAAALTQVGPYYLRETDQQMAGEIRYCVDEGGQQGEERTATFSMHDAGDFSRNHTWTVYAYYGMSRLEVLVVRVNSWQVAELVSHEVYNW